MCELYLKSLKQVLNTAFFVTLFNVQPGIAFLEIIKTSIMKNIFLSLLFFIPLLCFAQIDGAKTKDLGNYKRMNAELGVFDKT